MRNILALAAVAALAFAAVGWYLGWYKISSTTDSAGHQNIHIDVNKPKIVHDVNEGREKLRDALTSKPPAGERQIVMPDGTPVGPPPPLPPGTQVKEDGTIIFPGSPSAPSVPGDLTPRSAPPARGSLRPASLGRAQSSSRRIQLCGS